MRMKASEKRFFFHANAVGIAAHVRRPEDSFLPAVASTCLPVTGGVGKAEAGGANFGDLLSYRSVSTTVFGDFVDKRAAVLFTHGNHGQNNLATETTAEARVTGLSMSNGNRLLEIEALEAKMSASSDRRRVAQFHTLSAEFQHVRIDGVGLKVSTHCDVFTEHSTKQKLAQAFAKHEEFRSRYSAYFFSQKPAGSHRRRIPESGGIIFGTVVTSLDWEGNAPKGAAITGNSVKIDGFGSIYFGEILIEEGFRRLTLLRFQLGSPTGGSGSAAEVQTNGSSWPPRRSS